MLSAKRKSDGETVTAYLESKRNGPFFCLQCGDEVILKAGRSKVNHFAHATPLACRAVEGESALHRRCKMEIYEALNKAPGVSDVALERGLGTVRPDVSATIRGVRVAIEVQISSLSIETIMARTIEYFRKGIYVLWLLQWTPNLDARVYAPRQWEKWIHAAYYGHAYYWLNGLSVAAYQLEPSFKFIPKKSWYAPNGVKMTAGGYSQRSKRYCAAVRAKVLSLATDFFPKECYRWEGSGVTVPDAKLFMHRPA